MSEMEQVKLFTVEEANRLIPKLTEWLHDLHARQKQLAAFEVEIDALELVTKKPEEGLSPEIAKKVEEYNQRVTAFYEILDKIHDLGCYLKDVEIGLIDFCMIYQERMVYLCWKLGEAEITHWHDIGRGYSQRQPLILDSEEKESSG
ncbi:MAG: DUF2203 domain-containing protein [Candidatus Omnitrophica bacterium]|nr:DUF2203 domain-containing protein [Candidatus Omnitrophota bacterium]